MGMNISRTTDNYNSKKSTKQAASVQTNPNRCTKSAGSQRNDNATKLISPESRQPISPTCMSSSGTTSSASSRTMPKLGPSPTTVRAYRTRAQSLIREADQYWFERSLPTMSAQPSDEFRTINKPPWKPTKALNSSAFFQPDRSHFEPRSPGYCRHRGSRNENSNSSRTYNKFRGTDCSSLACLFDASMQTDDLHFLKCSAARKMCPQGTDALDARSVNSYCGYAFPFAYRHSRSRTVRTMPRYPSESVDSSRRMMRSADDVNRRNQSKEPDLRAYIRPNKTKSQTLQDDAFPLRYVFYVNDCPDSLLAFENGGRISLFARDTRCRVYFHAPARTNPKSDMKTRDDWFEEGIIEPSLYFQGVLVRPVTVAAPTLTNLRRFLELLDAYYPEFRASDYLKDQLVTLN
ncbi:unnamed protein product [Calicophoron daubneyi]|uniref:Uncharacterized protein n=1 Tax=Calicophoron daubneyi TaxID=300641 RepID=A0AAV2TSF7_CALDB